MGFAVTSSNTFYGNQTFSGSILAGTGSTYDLGSLEKPFRDLYITSESIKFVKDGAVLTEIKADDEQIKIGNIRITTSSIDLLKTDGTVARNVIQGTVNVGGEIVGGTSNTAPDGTISGSEQITSLGFISSSDSTTSLNTFTSSANIQLSNLESTTSSLEQRAGRLEAFTGSVLISSSAQITALGFVSESGDSTPAGTISGSEQITSLGFISSSDSTTSLNAYTASNDINITNIHSTTSSLEQRVGQIELNTGSYGGGGTDLTQLNTFTGSADQRLDSLENASGSYLTQSPAGTISGSAQITALGFVSESGGTNTSLNAYTESNDINITNIHSFTSSNANTSLNSYTSSLNAGVRITNLESTTSSFESRFGTIETETSSIDSRLDSIEAATGSYISNSDTSSMTVNSASIAEYTSEWNLTADGSNHYVFQWTWDLLVQLQTLTFI